VFSFILFGLTFSQDKSILIQEEYRESKRMSTPSGYKNPKRGQLGIYQQIGSIIKELRTRHLGRVVSQDELATAVGTTSNTISRWETATYKPSLEDLEKVARYFGVSIGVFFPNIEPSARLQALMSATGDLDDDDLDELTRYAQFRKARKSLEKHKDKR
jgi:transcriptional regulator with XRE-family HTH domain